MFPELQQYLHAPYTCTDWDSYGAAPVIPFAVQVCDLFMRCVQDRFGHYLAPYWSSADPVGGMMLHYETANAQFEFEVFLDNQGKVGWFLVDASIPVLDKAQRTFRYPFEEDTSSWWWTVELAGYVAGDCLRRTDHPRQRTADQLDKTG